MIHLYRSLYWLPLYVGELFGRKITVKKSLLFEVWVAIQCDVAIVYIISKAISIGYPRNPTNLTFSSNILYTSSPILISIQKDY